MLLSLTKWIAITRGGLVFGIGHAASVGRTSLDVITCMLCMSTLHADVHGEVMSSSMHTIYPPCALVDHVHDQTSAVHPVQHQPCPCHTHMPFTSNIPCMTFPLILVFAGYQGPRADCLG